MPQWTPFKPDEVYVAARITHVTGDRALIDLDIATRSSLAPILRQIEAAGLSPDAVALPSGRAGLPALRRSRRRRRVARRLCDLMLLGTAICLAIALATLSRSQALESLERLRSALRGEIGIQQEAARLSAEIARLEARHAFLAERIRQEIRFSSSAVAAAAILPPEAEVEELTWTPSSSRFVLAAPPGDQSPAWEKLGAVGKLRAIGKGAGDRELREWTVQSARIEP